jgi:hypothetical protein
LAGGCRSQAARLGRTLHQGLKAGLTPRTETRPGQRRHDRARTVATGPAGAG